MTRVFESGASRNSEEGKLDYEGFLSPLVLQRYAKYLHAHRKLEDGSLRSSDNWQQGIPLAAYMKSLWRHFMTLWAAHRGWNEEDVEEALCAILFNASGYLHEVLKSEVARREVSPLPGGMSLRSYAFVKDLIQTEPHRDEPGSAR